MGLPPCGWGRDCDNGSRAGERLPRLLTWGQYRHNRPNGLLLSGDHSVILQLSAGHWHNEGI